MLNNSPDPFDPESFRLKELPTDAAGIKKHISRIPVGRPDKQTWVRVHPDPRWRICPASIIELKVEREIYLVRPDIVPAITDECTNVNLYTVIDRSGNLLIWKCTLPSLTGRGSDWHRTALEAAEDAMSNWIRVMPNHKVGCYEWHYPLNRMPDPAWPEMSMSEILKIAFRDHVIDSEDHPVIQTLRGKC
jgi:hypothetical protein